MGDFAPVLAGIAGVLCIPVAYILFAIAERIRHR